MSRLTAGQWLDLATALAAATYAMLVVMLPSLAPLAEQFATPMAAGALASAAFVRFSGSVRAVKKAAASAAVLLLASLPLFGCASLSKAVRKTRSALERAEKIVQRETSKNADRAREALDRLEKDLDELEELAPQVDEDAAARREMQGL